MLMQVKETKNYEMFSTIDGNRPKNQLHLIRLKKSMEEQLLVSPIIVNEKYQVIDGQHRLQVSSELNLPVRYIVCNGYGLNEVHRLNQNSKNWATIEFVQGYADMGLKEYQYLLDFSERHNFTITQSVTLLANNGGDRLKQIQKGKWVATYKERGETVANWINILKQMHQGHPQKGFFQAMIHLYNNDNFDFSKLVSKLNLQPTALVPCVNKPQYLDLIESIYNYKSREKLNLRY